MNSPQTYASGLPRVALMREQSDPRRSGDSSRSSGRGDRSAQGRSDFARRAAPEVNRGRARSVAGQVDPGEALSDLCDRSLAAIPSAQARSWDLRGALETASRISGTEAQWRALLADVIAVGGVR